MKSLCIASEARLRAKRPGGPGHLEIFEVMRLPTILDVLDAVKRVAPAHPAAGTWWLSSGGRLPVRGEVSNGGPSVRLIELALEGVAGAAPDHGQIERELSKLLPGARVRVGAFRGPDPQGMIRLLSRAPERDSRGAGLSAAGRGGS